MSLQNTLKTNPVLQDPLGKRLAVAVAASVVCNLGLWAMAAQVAKHPPHHDMAPVEITRVIIDKQQKITPKIVTPKQIEHKLAALPKPKPKPEPRKEPQPVKPKPTPPPPPAGAHNKVLTAPDKGPAKSDEPPVLPGGNADVGKPTDAQNAGNAKANPPEPVKPAPPPPVVKQPDPKPAPAPPPVVKQPEPIKVAEVPKPEPEPVKPAPPPKPKGPTKEAEPADTVKPEIPDDLKHGDFRAFVRVKVEIEADGSATPILRTSSGNPEIDRRVLDALKRWKWKPALKDGVPVQSTQLFKFEFLVE
ncbi:MAG TPA: energy transducer TonB [Chthonomonadaceae bacterium]|nr:energy transducer TonB [Chthonomonadaceae bacterium]